MGVKEWCAAYVDADLGTYRYYVPTDEVETVVIGGRVTYPQYDGKLLEIGQAITDAGQLTDDDGLRLEDAGWSSPAGTIWMFAREYWNDAASKFRYHNVDYGGRLYLASKDLARLAGVPGPTWGTAAGYGISGICHSEPAAPTSDVNVQGDGSSDAGAGSCSSSWSWSWRSGLHHSWNC
jgi:hypothetical protein